MMCKDCAYCWQEEGESYPRCHFNGPFQAPCEYEDDYREEDDE